MFYLKKSHIFKICLLILSILVYNYSQNKIAIDKQKAVNNYFGYDSYKNNKTNYIAILEVPTISLRVGLVDKKNKDNDVSKNVMILNESAMPNENGNMYLAAHSGNSLVSYFNNIIDLSFGDLINIYYDNKKYIYEVIASYVEEKEGVIHVEECDKKLLVLTTCDKNNKNKQVVVVSFLKDIVY